MGYFDDIPDGSGGTAVANAPAVPDYFADITATDDRAPRPSWGMSLAHLIDAAANKVTGGAAGPDALTTLLGQGTREQNASDQIIPTIPQQQGTGAQIAAGAGNVPIGVANFLLSPEGVATTAGIGTMPAVMRRLVGLGFTEEAARHALSAPTLQEGITRLGTAALIGGGTAIDYFSDVPTKAEASTSAPSKPLTTSPPQPSDLRVGAEPVPEATQQDPVQEPAGSTPAPAASVDPALPDWLSANRDVLSAVAEKSGVADKIEELHAQRFTAGQIADRLGIDADVVRAVRAGRGLPERTDAVNIGLAGGSGAPENPEFTAWAANRAPKVNPAALAAANEAAAPVMADAAQESGRLGDASLPETVVPEQIGAQRPRTVLRASGPDGGFSDNPLVRFVMDDMGGILSKSAAKAQLGERFQPNLYDDAPRFPDPRHNKVYNSKGGRPADVVAQAAADAGLLPQGADSSTLFQALQGIADSAHSIAKQERAQSANVKVAEKQFRSFTAAVAKPARGEAAINASDLQVGDTVKIGTETMKVTDIDPDTFDVTIEDGSKFGVQHVGDQEVIYGEHAPAGSKVGQLGEPSLPVLRAGERGTAELFQGQDQPFNLAGEKAVDGDAITAAANAQQSAAHDAAVWQEQNQVPFGFGPGAAAAGESLRIASQVAQLTATLTRELRTARPTAVTSRIQRAINAVGGKVVGARQSLQRGAATVKATWLAIKNGYLRPPVTGEFKDALKDWQGADQRTSFEVRQFVHTIRDQIRDPLIREAITNYIQADGDPAILQDRAARSNIKYRPGYEAAMRLTDPQKTLAANIRQYFDGMLQDGINAGLLDHGLDNYITQVWKRPNKFTQELMADVQSGKLQTNFSYARKRVFDSFFDGEQAGYAPASKDVSALVAAYDLAFNRSMSARGFVKNLRDATSPNGEPVVKFSGMTQPVPRGAEAPEAYLIRSRALPESAVTKDGRAYKIVDHPSLRGWKFVVQDGATIPAYYQADMLVHPDYAPQLRNILGSSWLRQNPVTGTMLKAGAIAKQTRLALSIFHLDQEGLHGLFHRVNPANLTRIDFNDPTQWALVRGGLQVADYHAMELFSEGLTGGGLVSKIPVLGELQNRFNEFLFKDYIPRLKMTMALHAFERNVVRYGPSDYLERQSGILPQRGVPQLPSRSQPSPGTQGMSQTQPYSALTRNGGQALSPAIIAELTARQANAAFGELNYKLMARSPAVQDFMRLAVLAPDFLEARGRFVAQALKPYGREQRAALMLGAATMYVAARALNQWLDNDPHWGKPFSVIYNGREYRLRTVMGDAGEIVTDPRRFFYNRMSPWLKLATTIGTKRDYRGIKLSNWDVVKDTLSWFVPIGAGTFEGRGLPSDIAAAAGGRLQPITNRVLGTAGVSNKPAETPVTMMYDLATKFRENLRDPHIQMEVKRAQQETYAQSDYAGINRAIQDGDNERAVAAIADLLKQGKPAETMVKYYSNLPGAPFTGSRTLEAQLLAGMRSPDAAPQRALYQSAVNQRINMARTFFQLLPLATRRNRQ